MSSLSNAVQSSLLTLPSECRSVIFQHVFGEVAVQAYNISDTFKMNVSGRPQISLLRVSRQVYYEAEDALADCMVLFVNINNNGIRLASSMIPGLVARLRHVQVLSMRPNTLSGMPNLQVVNIVSMSLLQTMTSLYGRARASRALLTQDKPSPLPVFVLQFCQTRQHLIRSQMNSSGDITTIGHTETEIQKLREACTSSSRILYKTYFGLSVTLPAGCKVYRILPSFYTDCHVCGTNMGMVGLDSCFSARH